MVGGNGENQFRQYAGQNAGNLNGYNAVQNVRNQAKEKGCCLSSDTAVDCSEGRGENPTSSRRTDNAPVYDSDGSAEYTRLLEPIPEPQQVPQNDNNVISEVTDVEQDGETVEQHSVISEETRALYESLYQNLAVEVKK
nr:hypothetical protein [Tanacetum cinerariifolium]